MFTITSKPKPTDNDADDLTVDYLRVATARVDTVNEYTSANGVTIEGVLLKDGDIVDYTGQTTILTDNIDRTTLPGNAILIDNTEVLDGAVRAGSNTEYIDYYEEWETTVQVNTVGATSTSFFVTPQNMTFRVIRVGDVVCCSYSGTEDTDASISSTAAAHCTVNIPSRFLSTDQIRISECRNNGVNDMSTTQLTVSDGSCQFYAGLDSNFTTSAFIAPNSFSWIYY